MLRVLGRVHGGEVSPQVFDAAVGMHGAGRYGAQCGLVEGGLMFLGVWGKMMGRSEDWIVEQCNAYARNFESRFGSLLCRDLRPQGFADDQPPHLCEGLTVDAAIWGVAWSNTWPQ
jgi:hypothetical protein